MREITALEVQFVSGGTDESCTGTRIPGDDTVGCNANGGTVGSPPSGGGSGVPPYNAPEAPDEPGSGEDGEDGSNGGFPF